MTNNNKMTSSSPTGLYLGGLRSREFAGGLPLYSPHSSGSPGGGRGSLQHTLSIIEAALAVVDDCSLPSSRASSTTCHSRTSSASSDEPHDRKQ
eukprot:CAMPEP_0178744312 /NCGR_PEP_ID=MMETSP0744-20121128/6701_1 /TAXON_ID=913974 /ORGANISM="Nitzschia punctata, Strain CCMP561" /LENGTH=93 /DNA_ID=CAMNT_0020397433 /DNA_START=40 /DNA_END=321 /DNA_ORIENTATION=+